MMTSKTYDIVSADGYGERFDEVTERVAGYHGLSQEDADIVIGRLGLTSTDDREYLYCHPENLARFEFDELTGWVLWFDTSNTALSVLNGDPQHTEHVASLEDAISECEKKG
jgi:hypothetical protein